jgi:uncharacterized lipoprotein YmbA
MMKVLTAAAALAVILGGCGAAPDLFTVEPPRPTSTQSIGFASVEVLEVSLPAYAQAGEIAVQDADGRLVTDTRVLWADDPDRAVTLQLSRNLADVSGARIAPEPWPFEAFPQARLDVRFEGLVARADGTFRATGQYFVSAEDRRERAGTFDLSVPIAPEATPQDIARARGQIILELAEFIARDGLR